jgi:hypothetical protein
MTMEAGVVPLKTGTHCPCFVKKELSTTFSYTEFSPFSKQGRNVSDDDGGSRGSSKNWDTLRLFCKKLLSAILSYIQSSPFYKRGVMYKTSVLSLKRYQRRISLTRFFTLNPTLAPEYKSLAFWCENAHCFRRLVSKILYIRSSKPPLAKRLVVGCNLVNKYIVCDVICSLKCLK